MSHSVKVTLIADQEIHVSSEVVNIHDIRAVIVNSVGVITQVHKHSNFKEAPANSPASTPVQQANTAIAFVKKYANCTKCACSMTTHRDCFHCEAERIAQQYRSDNLLNYKEGTE